MSEWIIRNRYKQYLRDCEQDGREPIDYEDFCISFEDMLADQ